MDGSHQSGETGGTRVKKNKFLKENHVVTLFLFLRSIYRVAREWSVILIKHEVGLVMLPFGIEILNSTECVHCAIKNGYKFKILCQEYCLICFHSRFLLTNGYWVSSDFLFSKIMILIRVDIHSRSGIPNSNTDDRILDNSNNQWRIDIESN